MACWGRRSGEEGEEGWATGRGEMVGGGFGGEEVVVDPFRQMGEKRPLLKLKRLANTDVAH